MATTVDIFSNVDGAIGEMREKIPLVLEIIGMAAEGYAKGYCPVDTGRLRNSITHTVQGDSAYIGTNVEYAPYVEMGTSRMKAQPYLKPAVQNHMNEYKSLANKALKN